MYHTISKLQSATTMVSAARQSEQATVVADKQVDNAAATGVNVVVAGDKWTLTWSMDGSMDDVASWNVCYKNRDAFDAATCQQPV